MSSLPRAVGSIMSKLQHIPNGQIDPASGMMQSPAYLYAFDVQRKQQFLDLYKANGLKCKAACKALGVDFNTVQKHYSIDPVFRQKFDEIQAEYAEELESKAMQYAMLPKNFMDRCMQLRRLFPAKYQPEKLNNTQITLNISGDSFDRFLEKQKVVEAEVLSEESRRKIENGQEQSKDNSQT